MPHVKRATRPPATNETRERLTVAATELLATRGFAAATTRAIGEHADCNPALISYHFGSLNALLLEVLDTSSAQRMSRYRDQLTQARSVKDLRAIIRRLYVEDRHAGHTTILAELVAGGLMDRDLGAQVAARVQPWVDLAEDALRQVLPTATLRRRAPVRELGYALVAVFLGLEILGQLAGDHSRDEAVVHRLTTSRAFWQPAASTS